jgi:hypothetical protein
MAQRLPISRNTKDPWMLWVLDNLLGFGRLLCQAEA